MYAIGYVNKSLLNDLAETVICNRLLCPECHLLPYTVVISKVKNIFSS